MDKQPQRLVSVMLATAVLALFISACATEESSTVISPTADSGVALSQGNGNGNGGNGNGPPPDDGGDVGTNGSPGRSEEPPDEDD